MSERNLIEQFCWRAYQDGLEGRAPSAEEQARRSEELLRKLGELRQARSDSANQSFLDATAQQVLRQCADLLRPSR